MGSFSIFHLIILALVILGYVYPIARIFRRAGWNPWLSLLCLVPLANILMLWSFAFGQWPSLDEGKCQPGANFS